MQENYKILVVDDDMRLRALLERYLTEQGFQVRSVANAEQMDRLLTRESFHLMVLDFWATSLYRTALKHEAIALLATKFICPYVIAHRHLAVRQPGDDLSGGAELRDFAEPPAV